MAGVESARPFGYVSILMTRSVSILRGFIREQPGRFNHQLEYYSGRKWKAAKGWLDTFVHLREYMESLNGSKLIVVFLNELPWMDTQISRFIKAFEPFRNSWGQRTTG